MSDFHTEVDFPTYGRKTGYLKKNMFIGSCFTENIGNSMAELKFDTDINPFGILYNPVSIAESLKILLEKKEFVANDLICSNGLWHSFRHHGRFSGTSIAETLQQINERVQYSSEYIEKADFLFITFGTAWVYQFKPTGEIVSNCHKIPAINFDRYRLSVDQIVEIFSETIFRLKEKNNKVQIVFTVSPIRHWGDGAIENQRSKAALILAIDKIISTTGSYCTYFPSYEIMMDELRDYRFYAEDMLHISAQATRIIGQKFSTKLVDDQSLALIPEIQKMNKALQHKPFQRISAEYRESLCKTAEKIRNLLGRYPFLKLNDDLISVENQITEINAKLNEQ